MARTKGKLILQRMSPHWSLFWFSVPLSRLTLCLCLWSFDQSIIPMNPMYKCERRLSTADLLVDVWRCSHYTHKLMASNTPYRFMRPRLRIWSNQDVRPGTEEKPHGQLAVHIIMNSRAWTMFHCGRWTFFGSVSVTNLTFWVPPPILTTRANHGMSGWYGTHRHLLGERPGRILSLDSDCIYTKLRCHALDEWPKIDTMANQGEVCPHSV